MIKPITYQGTVNYKANLYALEIKSRFIDQNQAHGYYAGYGEELSFSILNNNIIIHTGAFLICSRMQEIISPETIPINMVNNYVGYVIARIETYHDTDQNNCTLLAKIGTSLSSISLTQEDTYASDADSVNRVYEYPIYSFSIQNNTITNVQKLIKVIDDYARVSELVNASNTTATTALETAHQAVSTADSAESKADESLTKSNDAVRIAEAAETVANHSDIKSNHAVEKVAELEQQIGEKQGTTVIIAGTAQATYDATNVLNETDTINIDGGIIT